MENNIKEQIRAGINHIWIWIPGQNTITWGEAKEGINMPCIGARLDDWNKDLKEFYKFDDCCKDYNTFIGKTKARTKIQSLWNMAINTNTNDIVLACKLSEDQKHYVVYGWCIVEFGYNYNPSHFNQHSIRIRDCHDVDEFILPFKLKNRKMFFTAVENQDAIDFYEKYFMKS